MGYDYEKKQKITGNSLDDCKDKLFRSFGPDFRIIDKNCVPTIYYISY